MKRFALFLGLATALLASCSTKEIDFKTPLQDDVVFYASFEQPSEDGTRVYANEDLLLRWTADDRISIFNRNTFNQQYRFTGETGDNAGGFDKVAGSEFATGNAIPHVVSVYPYQSTTKISESESLTLTLPAEQHYAENSFGPGASTMVSVTADNFLQYKTVGGYLRLRLYGDGVSVSSITLKGNNGEKLAGKATVTMPLDGTPTVTLAEDATDQITMTCDTPVALGATAEESKDFWFVVPPVTFSKGFSITINASSGWMFEKTTDKTISIERNKLSKMSPIEVCRIIRFSDETVKQICVENWDTNGDGELSYREAAAVTTFRKGSGDRPSVFYDNSQITSFDEIVHFTGLTTIEPWAFANSGLVYMYSLPEGVTEIGEFSFSQVPLKYMPLLPATVKEIGRCAFGKSRPLSEIYIPGTVERIGDSAFVDSGAYYLFIGDGVKEIGQSAFAYVPLETIIIKSIVPPSGAPDMFYSTGTCPIYVPAGSVDTYKSAPYWSDYADRIQANPSSVVAVTEITLNKTSLSLNEGSAETLVATVKPDNATDKSVTWSSSNTAVATVSDAGLVRAIQSGTASITAQAGNVSAVCIVTVTKSGDSTPVPEAVDLGLSVKWASFNVGASKPEEYGDYFAWGETEPKSFYAANTYKWCISPYDTHLTKYTIESNYSYGQPDYKRVLDLEDDAANANLGGKWRMPTLHEWFELEYNCTWEWTLINGIQGEKVTGPNGNSIFLPAAGFRIRGGLDRSGSYGKYWTSEVVGSFFAYFGYFYTDEECTGPASGYEYRWWGFSVRPVTE